MVRLSRFVSYVAVAAVVLAGFIVVGPQQVLQKSSK